VFETAARNLISADQGVTGSAEFVVTIVSGSKLQVVIDVK
jgi:hypothetical protein